MQKYEAVNMPRYYYITAGGQGLEEKKGLHPDVRPEAQVTAKGVVSPDSIDGPWRPLNNFHSPLPAEMLL